MRFFTDRRYSFSEVEERNLQTRTAIGAFIKNRNLLQRSEHTIDTVLSEKATRSICDGKKFFDSYEESYCFDDKTKKYDIISFEFPLDHSGSMVLKF